MAQHHAPLEGIALVEKIESDCRGTLGWFVMNRDETAYCMTFDHHSSSNPEREAEEWMERSRRERPGWLEANGYHLVKRRTYNQVERLALEAARQLRVALGLPASAPRESAAEEF